MGYTRDNGFDTAPVWDGDGKPVNPIITSGPKALSLYEVLIDTGTYAHIWQGYGNNLAKLVRECRDELRKADMLFGLYMDRTQNAVGDTGWDWIAGNLCAYRNRSAESESEV